MTQSSSYLGSPCSNSLAAGVKSLPSVPVFSELPDTGNAVFDAAVRIAFHHEGYYSNDPNDPGGPTIYGISLRTAKAIGDFDGDGFPDFDLDHDGDVDIDDIRQVTPDFAVAKYKQVFWDPFAYDRLPGSIACKVFDLAINMGPRQAHLVLQRSIRACADDRLTEDGIIGAKTILAAEKIYQPALLSACRSEAAGFYRLLCATNPKSRKYQNGWLNRRAIVPVKFKPAWIAPLQGFRHPLVF